MKLLYLMIKYEIEWPIGAMIAMQDSTKLIKWSESDNVIRKPLAGRGHWWRNGNGKVSNIYFGAEQLADDWSTRIVTFDEWQQERDKMQKQPVQPAQDNSWHDRGELPPVGGVCEAMINGEWIAAEVLRHRINSAGMNVAAVMSCASFGVYWAADFRPLSTEREKAIDEITSTITDDRTPPLYVQKIASKLYDAGYRKEQTK